MNLINSLVQITYGGPAKDEHREALPRMYRSKIRLAGCITLQAIGSNKINE
jgi:hypothetical protein